MTRLATTPAILGILVGGMLAAGLAAGCGSNQVAIGSQNVDAAAGRGGALAGGSGGSATGGAPVGAGGSKASGGKSTASGGSKAGGGTIATGGANPSGGTGGTGTGCASGVDTLLRSVPQSHDGGLRDPVPGDWRCGSNRRHPEHRRQHGSWRQQRNWWRHGDGRRFWWHDHEVRVAG